MNSYYMPLRIKALAKCLSYAALALCLILFSLLIVIHFWVPKVRLSILDHLKIDSQYSPLPFNFNIGDGKHYAEISIQSSSFSASSFELFIDDCLLSLSIEGVSIASSDLLGCDYKRRRFLDLRGYLHNGSNLLKLEILNKGGNGGALIQPTSFEQITAFYKGSWIVFILLIPIWIFLQFRTFPRFLRPLLYLLFLLFFIEGLTRAALLIPYFKKLTRTEGSLARELGWFQNHERNPQIFFSFDVFNPLLGWCLPRNARFSNMWGNKTVTTDELGTRCVTKDCKHTSKDLPRVLFIGDSFTFGEGVNDEESFPALSQSKLQNANIYNLGVHGYGHDQMLLRFEELAPSLHPQLIVLGFTSQDMIRNALWFRDFLKPRFTFTNDDFQLSHVPNISPQQLLVNPIFFYSLDLIALALDSWNLKKLMANGRIEAVTSAILEKLEKETEAARARLLIINLPMPSSISLFKSGKLESGEEYIENFCKQHHIEYLSLTRELSKIAVSQQLFLPSSHYSAFGNEAIANGIVDKIESEIGQNTSKGSMQEIDQINTYH